MAPKKPAKGKKTGKTTNIRAIARQEAKKVVARESEMKHHYVKDENVPVPCFTAPIWPLALLVQGDTEDERNGDWITPSYLRVRGCFSVGDDWNNCRLVIFQYKDDGNAPTSATLLEYDATSVAPFSPFNDTYKNSYNVIYDKVFRVDDSSPRCANFDIKLKESKFRKIQYSGVDSIVYRSGGLFMMAISDSNAVAHPEINFTSAFYYRDM